MNALASLAVVLHMLPGCYGLFDLDVALGFDSRCLGLVGRNPISTPIRVAHIISSGKVFAWYHMLDDIERV